MTCPNPFEALQSAQFPLVKAWDSHCDWTAYLQSDAAFQDSTAYLRKGCINQFDADMATECASLNQYCGSTEFVFASRPLLTVCSLYSNMTLNALGVDMSTSNMGINNASRDHTQGRALGLSSMVSTGLISYCAMIPGCSSSAGCSTAFLSTTNGQLSSHGVANCWKSICNSYVASINPDFGGLGMILSYLIQTSIAMLSFVIIVVNRFIKLRRSKRHAPLNADKQECRHSDFNFDTPSTKPQPVASPHLSNFHRFLSDFHKLQCYYSITLQIASFIALYGPPSITHSIKNPFDEAFLLLVSTNGIIPIAIMFYTLGLCNRVNLYNVLLTSLSAILGSCTGIQIVKLLSKPHDKAKGAKLSDSGWPAATGGLAPEGICGRKYEITYPKKLKPEKVFLAGAALCDALIFTIISQWLIESFSHRLHISLRDRHLPFIKRSSLSKTTMKVIRRVIHVAAAFTLIWCTAMEYFFFYQTLVPQHDRIVNFNDWGFGQIVGIAVWAVAIVDFLGHEIGSLLGDSVRGFVGGRGRDGSKNGQRVVLLFVVEEAANWRAEKVKPLDEKK